MGEDIIYYNLKYIKEEFVNILPKELEGKIDYIKKDFYGLNSLKLDFLLEQEFFNNIKSFIDILVNQYREKCIKEVPNEKFIEYIISNVISGIITYKKYKNQEFIDRYNKIYQRKIFLGDYIEEFQKDINYLSYVFDNLKFLIDLQNNYKKCVSNSRAKDSLKVAILYQYNEIENILNNINNIIINFIGDKIVYGLLKILINKEDHFIQKYLSDIIKINSIQDLESYISKIDNNEFSKLFDKYDLEFIQKAKGFEKYYLEIIKNYSKIL